MLSSEDRRKIRGDFKNRKRLRILYLGDEIGAVAEPRFDATWVYGGFTRGPAFPSVEQILAEMEVLSQQLESDDLDADREVVLQAEYDQLELKVDKLKLEIVFQNGHSSRIRDFKLIGDTAEFRIDDP